jgi:hypothetical protein
MKYALSAGGRDTSASMRHSALDSDGSARLPSADRNQSGNASGPRSESSRACSPESSGGIHE